jgi:hypothetical protein
MYQGPSIITWVNYVQIINYYKLKSFIWTGSDLIIVAIKTCLPNITVNKLHELLALNPLNIYFSFLFLVLKFHICIINNFSINLD